MTKTKVLFRMHAGEVVALFPEIPGTNEEWTCSCYVHVGQHNSADPKGVVNTSRPATEAEYAPLKRELESYPYNYELEVAKRLSRSMMLSRIAELRRAK